MNLLICSHSLEWIEYWQFFVDDQQIKEFFTMVEEFQGTKIDQDEDEIAEVAR